MASDDARFYGSDARGVSEHALVSDTFGGEFLADCGGGLVGGFRRSLVGADGAEHFDLGAEGREIGGDVACTAEAFGLLYELDDGDGGLGGEARGGAPKVAVEHEVADYPDAGVS